MSRILRLQKHPFHLVKPSPLPALAALGAFLLLHNIAHKFHETTGSAPVWLVNLEHTKFMSIDFLHLWVYHFASSGVWYLILVCAVIDWFTDVIMEGTKQRHHTAKVRTGLRAGMILFIVSEIFFFLSFFLSLFS